MIISNRLTCRIWTKYVRVFGTCGESKQNEVDELKATVFKQTVSYTLHESSTAVQHTCCYDTIQQYNTHVVMTLYSSTTHMLLVTKLHLVGIIHWRNNTILSSKFVHHFISAPNISCGDVTEAHIYHKSPVCLQTNLCFTPLKPKIPFKCKFIPYTQDNAASPSQRPVHWWWGSTHTGVPQTHSYRCVTGCTSGRWHTTRHKHTKHINIQAVQIRPQYPEHQAIQLCNQPRAHV
jgi:hypothetical protein